jgi:PAS domain S-box-containing protein
VPTSVADRDETGGSSAVGDATLLPQARLLYESPLVGVYTTALDGRPLDANDAGWRMLGYPSKEAFLAEPSVLRHWAGAGEREAALAKLKGGQDLHSLERELVRCDGSRFWVTVFMRLDQAAGRIDSIAVDISERKRAFEGLERRGRVLAAINAILSKALGCDSVEELARACVEVAAELTASRLGCIGELDGAGRVATLAASDGFPGFEACGVLARALAEARPLYTNQPHDGLDSLLCAPLLDGERVVGLIGLANKPGGYAASDLEAADALAGPILQAILRRRAELSLRAAELQVRQAQKLEALGKLAGGAAHNFNNLMTSVLMNCHVLLEDRELGRGARECVEDIRQAASKTAEITRHLLGFSGRQLLRPRVTELNASLAGLEPMLRNLLGDGVELALALAPELWPVRVDPARIEEAVLHLALNALDALPEGRGKLTIETANVHIDDEAGARHRGLVSGPQVMVAVSDTGRGMDAGTLARVFDPFFTTKELGAGHGLGLSAVYGMVKQSGGTIWGYSEPGRGTTFKIYLPRSDARPRARARAARARHRDRARRRGQPRVPAQRGADAPRPRLRGDGGRDRRAGGRARRPPRGGGALAPRRRGDAGDDRPRAGGAPRRVAARAQGALHLRLPRRRDRPARLAGSRDPVPAEAVLLGRSGAPGAPRPRLLRERLGDDPD